MKRDMDLIRKILLEMERLEFDGSPVELEIGGYDLESVNYHCLLLDEAGLIKAQTYSVMEDEPDDCQPIRLTWAGHEFLDAARDDVVWKKAMKLVARHGGVAFELLRPYLMQEMSRIITGVPLPTP